MVKKIKTPFCEGSTEWSKDVNKVTMTWPDQPRGILYLHFNIINVCQTKKQKIRRKADEKFNFFNVCNCFIKPVWLNSRANRLFNRDSSRSDNKPGKVR